MYLENLRKWQNANLKANLRTELNNLDEQQLKEAFYKDIDFGTAGLRGLMGVGTNRINEYVVKRSTKGFANYLNKNFKNPSVAISYDNRINSKEFAFSAAKVLAANNIKVYITPELRPTPFLSFLIRHFNTSGGIMITASHNPKEYNGYKVYEPYGGQLNLANSEAVIKEISLIDDLFSIEEIDNELIEWVNLEALDEIYLKQVKTIKLRDYEVKSTILYSPLHGTGATLMPKLFEGLNYNFYTFKPHMTPDGNFTNTKSANPEERVAYLEAISYAKEINADIIVLTDPDADRIGVAIKDAGDYKVINGNQIASLTLAYILEQTKKVKNGYVFMSNVTSSLVETLAKANNLNVVKTLPGFKFIAEEINKLTESDTYVFGCEESNGNIISPFVRDKDAIQATLMLAEMASFAKSQNITLLDYLNTLYETYGYFLEETISFEFKGMQGLDQMNDLMNHFRNAKINLPNNDTVIMQDILKKQIYNFETNKTTTSNFPPQNIIRFEYSDGSWIMARPSGTEPKLKIYYSVKGINLKDASLKLKTYQEIVNNIIKEFQ